MGRETKTFRKRVESPPVSPHLEIVPTNLPPFFFFSRGGPCTPLHSPALISQRQRGSCHNGDTASCATLSHCQGQKKQQVSTTSRIPFPIVHGLRWRGDGVLRILCITMMPRKHHSKVTIWGGRGTSFFDSNPTFYRCSLF